MADQPHARATHRTTVRRVAGRAAVALETTLLAHGVPRAEGATLGGELEQIVRDAGGRPATIGVLRGTPVVGLSADELAEFLAEPEITKANPANLGVACARGGMAATTAGATIQLAAAAGIRVVATGGLGGVHPDLAQRLDVSADLAALARYPVAVACSGVKGLLDVASTRELLETLGVPVVGYRTDAFPAFYLRDGAAGVDARFDDVAGLAGFVRRSLAETGRGVLVAQPAPESHAIDPAAWNDWLAQARERAASATGRDVTPSILAALHEISGGSTLRANLALVRANARLGGELAAAMA
ncbi:MAG: pseudouridine-5'-phosphate glycosidase [Planctomycetota bacterium]